MSINLEIYNFENQLNDLVTNSQLPLGIVKYIFQDYYNQLVRLNTIVLQQELKQQQEEQKASKITQHEVNGSNFQIPFELEIPLDCKIEKKQKESSGQES